MWPSLAVPIIKTRGELSSPRLKTALANENGLAARGPPARLALARNVGKP